MLLLVWLSVENSSLLLSAEKPQVPATVRGKKKIASDFVCKSLTIIKFWWR